MSMRVGDRVEACGLGREAAVAAWSRPRGLVGLLAVTVLMIALALGLGGKTSVAQAEDRAPAATATPVCRTIPGYVNYKDQYGQKLASFYMSQKSCWDGTKITYLSAPTIRVAITRLGADSGWRYNGIAGRRDYFYEYKGSARGAHVTSRKYSFVVCPSGGSCYEKRPVVQSYAFYDKVGYTRSWG